MNFESKNKKTFFENSILLERVLPCYGLAGPLRMYERTASISGISP